MHVRVHTHVHAHIHVHVALEYRQCGRLVRAIDTEMSENGMKVVTLKNGYLYPTVLGYADFSMTVEIDLDDGTPYIVEVCSPSPSPPPSP